MATASNPQPTTLPDEALAAVLSFLPFHELQAKAFVSHQVSGLSIPQANRVIEQAETGPNYLHFVGWRFITANQLHTGPLNAASLRADNLWLELQIVRGTSVTLDLTYKATPNPSASFKAAVKLRQGGLLAEIERLNANISLMQEVEERESSKLNANFRWWVEERHLINPRGRRKRRAVVAAQNGKKQRG